MHNLPSDVHIMEVGMRDGLQSEATLLSVEQKLAILESILDSGIKEVEVGSFVNPKAVPQMANTADVFREIRKRPGVKYRALWLNMRGYEQARETGKVDLDAKLAITASETFSLRNTKRTIQDALQETREWMVRYREDGVGDWSLTVMSAFGCNFEGRIEPSKVVGLIRQVMDIAREEGVDIPEINLADTMGWANPVSISTLVSQVKQNWPQVEVKLHLHDTRGLAVANAMAGLQAGVRRFDASLGGIGGCPFAGNRGAAGNICTEDLVFLCEEQGIATGIDLNRAIGTATLVQDYLQHSLPGKLLTGGSRSKFGIQ